MVTLPSATAASSLSSPLTAGGPGAAVSVPSLSAASTSSLGVLLLTARTVLSVAATRGPLFGRVVFLFLWLATCCRTLSLLVGVICAIPAVLVQASRSLPVLAMLVFPWFNVQAPAFQYNLYQNEKVTMLAARRGE